MNKFRNNLHPAFFYGDSDPSGVDKLQNAGTLDQYKGEEKKVVEQIQEQEFPNLAGEVIAKITSRYSRDEIQQFNTDRNKFLKRINGKNPENSEYGKIWTKKITEGFGLLKKSLIENGYFKDKNISEELPKIKEQYLKVIYDQYEKYVWDASDKKFDAVKDKIFGREFGKDCPANKIYCKLTGAESIFTVERTARKSTIDAAALTGQQHEKTETVEQSEEKETINRQDRKFLSNDLPEYLWSIRKTPWVLKALSILPFFSVKEDRPSLVDRDAISDFLKVASKLTLNENSPYKNKDEAVALFEMFEKNSDLNTNNPNKFKEKLAEFGLKYKDKDFDDILRVGAFYIRTQANGLAAEDQHPIYLSVLEIIRQKGSVKNAVNDLKNLVEEAKTEKKNEKKQGYESGEAIEGDESENYKELAQKLGITDFRSATRLRKLVQDKNLKVEDNNQEGKEKKEKAEKHFNNVLTALADLDNNGIIDPKDIARGGTNTGMQFIDTCNLIGEKPALENLINRAKLQNAALNLGLNDADIKVDAISNGNPSVILLLQDIISKPGQDLYSLLSGESTKEIIDKDAQLKEECNALAAKFLNEGKINNKGIREWLEAQKQKTDNNLDGYENFANLQASLATFLYDNYKIGVGVGSTLSLHQWAKGLEIGTGIQFRDGGKAVLGLGITYKKNVDLGKGWTLTPALNAGAFLPIASGNDKDVGFSMGFGTSLDRKKINVDKHITRHQGVDLGVSYVIGSGAVAYLGFHSRRNKAEDLETFSAVESTRFTENTMSGILDEIINSQGGRLMLSGEGNNLGAITQIIDEKIKNLEDDKGELKANIIRLLLKYNGLQITGQNKDTILAGIRTDYERLRAESHKAEISKGLYFSGYSAGVYGGARGVGLYLAGEATKHDIDGYGYVEGRSHGLDNGEHEVWNAKLIENLNKRLGLVGNEKITFENDHIIIPKGIAYMVKVSENVKGLMAKDKDGNILVSKRTPMYENISLEPSTKTVELLIGGGKETDFKSHLDAVDSTRFVSDISGIDSKILEKRNAQLYTTEKLTEEVRKLKIAEGDIAKVLNKIQTGIGKLLHKDKELTITITKLPNSEYNVNITQGNPGSKVEIVLMEAKELFNSEAKEQAQKVYNWAAEQKDPTALYRIKHPHPGIEAYQNFAKALYRGEFATAKNYFENGIKSRLPKFPEIKWPTNEAALGQLLMSINNIFARAKDVIGRGSEPGDSVIINTYEIGGRYGNFGKIIERRADQIKRTINGDDSKIEKDMKGVCTSCIDAMEYVRKTDADTENSRYNVSEHRAASLHNTVGFNRGDKTNPENPLLGVEVYDNVMDAKDLVGKGGFTAEMRQQLHKHAMEEFIKNEALFNAIGKTIGKTHEEILGLLKNANFELDGNTGKLRLDFGDKSYIMLKADMKLGYYTQCVNHTVILDNISVENDGGKTDFGSSAWENGEVKYKEVAGVVASTRYSGGVTIGVSDKKKPEGNSEVETEGRAHNLGPTGSTTPTGTTENTDPTNTGTGTNSGNSGGRPGKR